MLKVKRWETRSSSIHGNGPCQGNLSTCLVAACTGCKARRQGANATSMGKRPWGFKLFVSSRCKCSIRKSAGRMNKRTEGDVVLLHFNDPCAIKLSCQEHLFCSTRIGSCKRWKVLN